MELPGFYFIPIWLILPRKLLFIFFITFQFALAFWFGTWRKKGAAEQKKTVEKSINPSASNDHPWINNYFRDRNVSNFETLKKLSDDLWNKKNEHFDLRYSSLSHHSCLSVEDFQIITVTTFPNIFQQNKFAPLLLYKRGVLGTTRVNWSPVSLGISSSGLLWVHPDSLLKIVFQGF